MSFLEKIDPQINELIQKELKRQNDNIEMIASENFTSYAVLEAQGSVLTNKYAEGYPKARWYNGCKFVDEVEALAIERAKKLFGAEHANVQPHSGTQANMAVYFTVLKPGDTVLAMDLSCGGHLSHGLGINFSGELYNFVWYGVDKKTEKIDYNEIRALAKKHLPKMIIAGASAYPRAIDFRELRKICDEVGAYLFVDMAHFAGLVAAGLHPNPVPYAEFVSSTTHKTLRGPRGGFILCKKRFAKKIDTEVFPGIQGGPLMHVIAAKAVTFKEAATQEFKDYQKQIVLNSKSMSKELANYGFRIVSGGTDTHLTLIDLTSKGLTGKEASTLLDKARITVNKNLIPFDKHPAAITSGIRIGTPAVTTRKMKQPEMKEIADLINRVLMNPKDKKMFDDVINQVDKLTKKFPLYPELLK